MAQNILLLFDRMQEPIYLPKGENKVVFEIPAEYLIEKYQPNAQNIFSRFGEEANSTIPIKKIAIPNIDQALKLGRDENFSVFIPKHRKMSDFLVTLFMSMRTTEDLLSFAAYCRDRVNKLMFVYSLSVALIHRPDTKNLNVPKLNEIFPSLFVENKVFSRAREEASVTPAGQRTPIEIPLEFTGSKENLEQRVAYFREDLGVNLHHWHWHIIYPFSGPLEVVRKDRRGELFFYMHHQIIARYNTERFCNKLGLTKPFENFRVRIPEGYFPKLDRTVAGQSWPSRPADLELHDVIRKSDDITILISTLETWRNRIIAAIRARSVRNAQNQTVALNETDGIDILGNMVEASILSPDQSFYGSLHNTGHAAISYIHDPKDEYLESFAVMASTTVSMRDPIFYRWHQFIDNTFYLFKDSLPAYTREELLLPGVTITNIRVNTPNSNPNTLNSHWNRSDINLTNGLDFVPRGAILARLQHLNHDDFTYSITVNNNSGREIEGTVRIFIAPRVDQNGHSLSFEEQRKLMIEMDKFTTRLFKGQNGITRKSTDSTITIPYETTFRSSNQSFQATNLLYCGCGWPQHMLVPKGSEQGFPMELFVMISNYELDKVVQAKPEGCAAGVSYCGLRDLKYPDKRAMGFPFDRRAPKNIRQLSDFLTPNMKQQQITVRFSNVIKARVASSTK